MARLTRVHQKVFASNASNNGVFGSLQAGNPQISNDVATLQSLSAFENGWDDAIEQGDKLPPLEEFQGVQYGISYQQAYILQEGIPEWNTNTPYYKGSITKVINGTSFKIFSSLTNNNTGNVTTNTTHWKLVYDSDIGYADTNFSNLLAPAKNIANWSDSVSNCITEIPQDIKLELSSGTLTLKSGSVITSPDGTQVQTVSDNSFSSSVQTNTKILFCTSKNGYGLIQRPLANCVSGAGATTVGGFAYDTTSNKIFYYNSQGVQGNECTLPVCICSTDSQGVLTSIDQVFNGAGYIGHHAFVLPGVKGLSPNGFNSDGTYKNTSITINSLAIREMATGQVVTGIDRVIASNAIWSGYKEVDKYTDADFTRAWVRYYVKEDNKIYTYTTISVIREDNIPLVFCNYNGTSVTKFEVKPVFQAADYYDVALKNRNNTFSGNNTFSNTITGSITGNAGTVTNGVYTTGNQTIGGAKTYSGSATFGNSVEFQVKPITDTSSNDDRYISKWSNYTQGTAPTDNVFGGVSCYDSNNVEMASCYGAITTNGDSRSALWVKSPVSGSSQTAQITIQCDSSGNFSTYAPTRSSATDNSNNIATTAWVNNWASANSTSALASWSNGANGYYKFKNGLIIQWGRWSDTANPSIVFPTAFSNTNYSITATDERDTTNAYGTTFWSKTTTGVTIHAQSGVGNWIAIGY